MKVPGCIAALMMSVVVMRGQAEEAPELELWAPDVVHGEAGRPVIIPLVVVDAASGEEFRELPLMFDASDPLAEFLGDPTVAVIVYEIAGDYVIEITVTAVGNGDPREAPSASTLVYVDIE